MGKVEEIWEGRGRIGSDAGQAGRSRRGLNPSLGTHVMALGRCRAAPEPASRPPGV
jgi:hypothetical protein